MANTTKVKLKAAELEQRKNELVTVDRKIDEVEAQKAKTAAEFNESLKAHRKHRGTLLNSIESGWEQRDAQGNLFDGDTEDDFDDEPEEEAPKRRGRGRAKKGAAA